EDGIRGLTVTGVQTCALPIYRQSAEFHVHVRTFGQGLDVGPPDRETRLARARVAADPERRADVIHDDVRLGKRPRKIDQIRDLRSEERRVGKGGRSGWWLEY